MKKSTLLSVTVLLSALLAGTACVKTTTTQMDAAAEAASHIKVYYDTPSDVEYEEMGLITTKTGQTIFHDRSATGMIEKMKAEAAAMGADAIIVRSVNEGAWSLKGGGNASFDRGDGQAIAIRFKNP